MVDIPIEVAPRPAESVPAVADSLPPDSLSNDLNGGVAMDADGMFTADTLLGHTIDHADDDGFPNDLTQMLSDTMAQRHVVVWREQGWRVPVAPILEFLAAVAIELLLLAAIVFLGMHGGLTGHGGRQTSQSSSRATAVGGVLASTAVVSAPRVPQTWHLSHHLPRPPTLPSTLHDPVAIKFAHPDNSHNAIIGVPRHADAWSAPTPNMAPRPVPHAVVSRHPARSRGPQPAAVRHLGQRSRNPNPNAGFGPAVPLLKGQRGGGAGAGAGRGRGLVDADGGVKVLAWGSQHVPVKYQIDPMYMRGTYRVWISASGRVTKVKIIKSCGHPSMDQSFIDTLERTRFSPAMSGGAPIPSKINITLSFGSRG